LQFGRRLVLSEQSVAVYIHYSDQRSAISCRIQCTIVCVTLSTPTVPEECLAILVSENVGARVREARVDADMALRELVMERSPRPTVVFLPVQFP
jgi:hypothetical protein